jgi:hypothetical protein
MNKLRGLPCFHLNNSSVSEYLKICCGLGQSHIEASINLKLGVGNWTYCNTCRRAGRV